MTTFKRYDDVAAVETDPETLQPLKDGQVIYGTITRTSEYGISVRFSDGDRRAFLVRNGEIIQVSHHWRLVPVCYRASCDRPVLVPVTSGSDPLGRQWCSEDCLTDDAERAGGAHADIKFSDGYERTVW